MRVGVPIVSTNEGELLRHTLPLVLAQDDVEVVVFDNASTDDTAEVARASSACATCAGTSATRSAGR